MFSNIPKDKLLHFFYGTILSFIFIIVFGIKGLWFVVFIAAAKELIYDWYMGKGNMEFNDFMFTCIPVIMFLILKYNEFI
tara:strand:- start:188 stop:427 length:240 start_codon:yes stop_codon:yes gene_type:complete